jgi:hypothetical protein
MEAGMRAYLIDPAQRTIRQIELAGWRELNVIIECDAMTMAAHWHTGDVLYVDDEGFHKPEQHFFRLADRPEQPLVGRGLVVGRELENCQWNQPPTMTLAALEAKVTWLDRDQARAMVAGRPAATVTSLRQTEPGYSRTMVVSWWDDLIPASARRS